MNFCGPQLEELLLTGQAVYKNAALGYGALIGLQVPVGKTYIITKINIQPFLNVIDNNGGIPALEDTFVTPCIQDLTELISRIEYNLLVYNNRVSNRWQLRSEMDINQSILIDGGLPVNYTLPTLKMYEKNIDCFIVTEETMFFFLSFPSFATLQYSFQLNPLSTVYLRYNSFPEGSPGYQDSFQTVEAVVIPIAGGFTYLPLGIQNTNTGYNNTTNTITIPTVAGNLETQIVFPYPDNSLTNANATYTPSLPVFNIEYIEINKRTTTKGI